MNTFFIKQGDTAPAIQAALKDQDQNPIGLIGATVKFNMRDERGKIVIDRADAVILDEAAGIVCYYWQDGDTSSKGTCDAEFEVTYPNNTVETFPNDGNIKVKIARQVG